MSVTQVGVCRRFPWFLLSRCVREKQRSVGELLPCTCGQEARQPVPEHLFT